MKCTMETYSRSYLNTLSVYRQAYQVEDRIVKHVLQEASSGHTRFIVNQNWFYEHYKKEQITDWLVSRLKQRFPDVLVEYREATDLRGNIERGIIIDWTPTNEVSNSGSERRGSGISNNVIKL